jgi:hypothetical protein
MNVRSGDARLLDFRRRAPVMAVGERMFNWA